MSFNFNLLKAPICRNMATSRKLKIFPVSKRIISENDQNKTKLAFNGLVNKKTAFFVKKIELED